MESTCSFNFLHTSRLIAGLHSDTIAVRHSKAHVLLYQFICGGLCLLFFLFCNGFRCGIAECFYDLILSSMEFSFIIRMAIVVGDEPVTIAPNKHFSRFPHDTFIGQVMI